MAIAMVVAVAPLMTASPASAVSGRHVGHYDIELRCWGDGGDLCLYYNHGMTTGAYWGTAIDDSNLNDQKFFAGTGTGSLQVVKNNATAMSCSWAASRCYSYYNSGYSGNYDWEYGSEVGQLYYTWNNDASVVVLPCVYLNCMPPQ